MSKLRSGVRIAAHYVKRRNMTRIYCVGAAKTGTHSLTTMFGDGVRTAHEPDAHYLLRLYLDSVETGDARRLRRFLRFRDARNDLRIDVSQVNIYLVEHFLELFPDSRYILTVRPPMSWLRSFIDDSLRRDVDHPVWIRFRHFRFDRPEPFPPEEEALREAGAFQIAGYLQYWRDAIERVTSKVSADRLLVVRTEDLAAQADEIARFCGISAPISVEKSHSFANPTRFGLLDRIPEEHLLAVAERECGELMRQHFPERSLEEDVRRIRSQAA